MKKNIWLLIILASTYMFSQEETDSKQLNEVKIETKSNRYLKSRKVSPQQIQTISQKEIEFENYQTTSEMLSNSGKLFVQKSQQGGGSPVIRGLESSRVLLLIDGIRMNNLIYRGGHLQNVITIDENMLESSDILFGSSSTNYGSDAMGGAINLITKKAKLLSDNNNKAFSGNFNLRYGSVNEEKSGYFDFNFSGKKWASLTAISYNDFGDLKMGKKTNGDNGFFGLRPKYISTTNGVDAIVDNPDPYIQKFSGYKQYNVMQKVVYKPNSSSEHNLNIQFSTTNDIPRYDRLTDLKSNGDLKTATWNYGPQKRILAAYQYNKQKALLNSDLNIAASYQNIEESRITRDYQKTGEVSRIEKVNIYGLNIDLKAKIGKGELLYGIDTFYDDLNSTANTLNVIDGSLSSASTRYPDGKNYNYKADVFISYFGKINENTVFNLGARSGFNKLHNDFNDKTFFPFPYSTIDQNTITYSGAAGITNQTTPYLKLGANISSGFRTPNVDDLTKVFESAKGSSSSNGTLIVPNPDIKPEKNVTADVNLNLSDNKYILFENTFFYTKLFDVIAVDNFTFEGQSVINYNGFPADVKASQNLDKGYIYGYSTSLKVTILENLKFYGNYNFTYGRALPKNKSVEQPLDHIPPFYGKVGFNYDNKWFTIDLNMIYNGAKKLKDYSSSGEDNLQYAPATGTPSWETYNFKTSVKAIKNLTIYLGAENILDIQYRTFASGINAPGRNLYSGLKYIF